MLLIISTFSVSCVLSSVFECVRSISRGKRYAAYHFYIICFMCTL